MTLQMPGSPKTRVIETLTNRFGTLSKLVASQSLYLIGSDAARIYFRYSKLHSGRGFFGLRKSDLDQLEGHNSFICFLVDDGSAPVFVPYSDFEELFRQSTPAADGQFKVQLFTQLGIRELYIAREGRFNVEGFVGFDRLARSLEVQQFHPGREFTHSQVQTLLAGIGHAKGYDVYVPSNNVAGLDWSLTKPFSLLKTIPNGYRDVSRILAEIDVLWVAEGRNAIEGLFEVEHSTSIYSGLLRLNDVFLANPEIRRFSIVSDEARRSAFARQAFRPTFRKSGLSELVGFMEYANVYWWHRRLVPECEGGTHQ